MKNNRLSLYFNNLDENYYQIINYAASLEGKLIRSKIFFSILEDVNMQTKDYQDIFDAIELMHLQSLIFDDLPAMDNDNLRRGQITIHKKYNEASAILIGLNIYEKAIEIILKNKVLSSDLKNKIALLFLQASSEEGILLGQYMDLNNYNNYEKTYYYKTAKMIELPFLVAKIINPNIKLPDNLDKLGIAFQMQDDLLEQIKSTRELGKSNKSDEQNNKKTIINQIGQDQTIQKYDKIFKNIILDLEKNNLLKTANLIKEIQKREN